VTYSVGIGAYGAEPTAAACIHAKKLKLHHKMLLRKTSMLFSKRFSYKNPGV